MNDLPPPLRQSTHRVLMVRPATFYSNPETAQTNAFQQPEPEDASTLAQGEFDTMVVTLRQRGIEVITVDDTSQPETPDAVFPNNWLSTHADGSVVTYPMQPVSRRAERRADVVQNLSDVHGLAMARHVDLSLLEQDEHYLEGTGSLVLDRVHRRAYACLSPRTTMPALTAFCQKLDYEPIAFSAFGEDGTAVYHTNVMMCVGSAVIVACVDAIAEDDRERVTRAMGADHQLMPISLAQMNAFAGNMIELRSAQGYSVMVLSQTAFDSLSDAQRDILSGSTTLLPIAIPTIETAGGSVRCMIAEIFLPEAASR